MVGSYPITVIVGKRGFGKTTYAARLCRRRPRTVVVDPKSFSPGRVAAYRYEEPYGVAGARFFDGPLVTQAAELEWVFNQPTYTVVFRQNTSLFEVFDVVQAAGNCHFHVDELNLFRDDYAIQQKLKKLLQVSRTLRVSFSCCAQRPQALLRDVTELADELIIFRSTGPLVLDYLKEFSVELDIDRIPTLGVGEYVRVPL